MCCLLELIFKGVWELFVVFFVGVNLYGLLFKLIFIGVGFKDCLFCEFVLILFVEIVGVFVVEIFWVVILCFFVMLFFVWGGLKFLFCWGLGEIIELVILFVLEDFGLFCLVFLKMLFDKDFMIWK